MPGGLLNLITTGEENVLLNGNPTKSFFKSVYSKYTNFGLQKFRLDYKGIRSLLLTESSHFSFTVPRHGDLLMDTYFVIDLPNIYSGKYNTNKPYNFKWIKNIGTEIIQEVEIHAGGHTLQKFSGTGINLLASRDYSYNKKKTFDEMIGNITELNDPANYSNRNGQYPNSKYYQENEGGPGPSFPSINGKKLYIPLPFWFCQNSQQALPLVALQYTEVIITFKLRPLKDLFTICDEDGNDIKPNFNIETHQFHNFIKLPTIDGVYEDKSTDWNHDIHLIANYAFLSKEENNVFISKPQRYLIKDVYENIFYDLVGHNKVKTFSSFLVISWMFAFRRSDVSERNGWSNFTNWKYPENEAVSISGEYMKIQNGTISGSGYVCSPSSENNKIEIITNIGIQIDGKYRENVFDAGIFKYLSTFTQSPGNLTNIPFIYNYNFCLDTSNYKSYCCPIQPNGAINLSGFKDIEIELTTIIPPIHDEPMTTVTCDPETGAITSITKNLNSIYHYTYDMFLIEERYNVLTITNGTCGLRYAR